MYEVELKTALHHGQKEHIIKAVKHWFKSDWTSCVYNDTYFDTLNQDFARTEKEVRLRKMVMGNEESVFITCKEPPFDEKSKSKIEHEIKVSDYDEASVLLKHLGLIIDVSFNKYCQITQIEYGSFKINITLTDIDRLPDTFMEVEVLTAESNDVETIFPVLHQLLALLKVFPEQQSNEYYTDMVRKKLNAAPGSNYTV